MRAPSGQASTGAQCSYRTVVGVGPRIHVMPDGPETSASALGAYGAWTCPATECVDVMRCAVAQLDMDVRNGVLAAA
ncbi:hypothetical protein [Actinomadura oligospora]|uniref:hypothetical protein n=1 Tax=Actinomadura oligospora TaxID=111804 RepID=UPI00047BF9F5|nr:hypothetical protein [Actinomadura oligospora]